MSTKNFPPSIVKLESYEADRAVVAFDGKRRTIYRYVGLDADGVRWAWYQDHESATDHEGVTMLFEGTPYGWRQISGNAEAANEVPLNPEVFPPERMSDIMTFDVDTGWYVVKTTELYKDNLLSKTVFSPVSPDNVRWQANWPSEFEARHIEFDLETGRLLGVHKPANTPEQTDAESDNALVEWHKLTPAQQAAIIAVATTNNYFEHQAAIDELFRARHIKYDRLWGAYELTLTGRGMYEAYSRSIKQDDQS